MTSQQQNTAIAETGSTDPHTVDTLINQVGHLTRMLHNSLRELGYNKRLEEAAATIPDAQDRLAYVAQMTEQAALRVLNATEVAKPIQDKLAADATALSKLWQQFDASGSGQTDSDAFRDLLTRTRSYLNDVPNHTSATNAQLMEVMMAQDFQDLTGQVMKKITKMVQGLEQELLRLLMNNVPADKKEEINEGLLNGPVVNSAGRTDVVANQDQVDDLLASLGF